MSQEIETPKRRGRPRKNPINVESSDIDTPIDTEEDTAVVAVIDEDEEEAFNFVSTGNDVKDRALKGVISDSFELFKIATKKDKWEEICASANPAGACEKFAIAQYVSEEDVIPTLKLVKRLIIGRRDGLTVIKAFDKYMLKDLIDRVVNIESDTAETTEDVSIENHVQIEMSVGTVLTCPTDPSKTYTIGSRGRISNWAKEMIESHKATQNIEDETVVDIETETDDKSVIVTEMSVGTIITCPTDPSKTYVVGSRGRKPLWIKDLELQSQTTNEVIEEEQDTIVDIETDDKTEIVNQKTLTIGTVLTCPTDPSKTYIIGKQKGRRSQWITDEINRLTQE